MSRAYYNEIDPYCCDWLRNLIAEGLIPDGDVDGRSIHDVQPDDLRGYTQCHFFAGIAGWALALRLAGWPDDRPVWTGSCPCQPFSAAGKRGGTSDERHLWPEFRRLIAERKPPAVFGEQVASPLGRSWLATVRSEMEALGYGVGAADCCAAGVGAPHIRQRLWFVGIAYGVLAEQPSGPWPRPDETQSGGACGQPARPGHDDALADRLPAGRPEGRAGAGHGSSASGCAPHALDDAPGSRHDRPLQGPEGQARHETRLRMPDTGCGEGHWSDCIWLPCTDGKARPTQPGIFPLAHGIPARVAKLRAAGNAIVPALASQFIKAVMEC